MWNTGDRVEHADLFIVGTVEGPSLIEGWYVVMRDDGRRKLWHGEHMVPAGWARVD